jgi:hypothetical protein
VALQDPLQDSIPPPTEPEPEPKLAAACYAREREILAIAETMSGQSRDDLILIAMRWRRMGQRAEQALLKAMEQPTPK